MPKKKSIKPAPSSPKAAPKGKPKQSKISIPETFPFTKWNFVWMGVGLLLIVVGYVMMYDADGKDIFAPERITYPTILVMLGYAVEIYAILARFGNKKSEKAQGDAGQ